ncbi:pathogenesis-related protein PR-1-like [Chenopodium quinoa]|uniref:pathogenesis-related protein PR-1-like n=1 Tax=Chenopodium quinoa TaxID=63459 RepID=UPI000B78ADB5|nr:pathogenesis-related protein PR-1-like [Chenopodium quinoa]
MAKTLQILSSLFLSISILIILIQVNPAKARINTTEFINEVLDGHNAARKAVGVPPLRWENLLAKYAQIYSSRQRRQDCKLIHSTSPFGENLFWGSGKRWTAKDAVAAWVDEKQWYDYSSNSCTSGYDCGHYTQAVWKQTILVGCSKIICDSGDSFITCEYYPTGNYVGEKPY